MKLFAVAALAALLFSPAAHAEDIAGKVVETMDSGGYTYLRIQTAGGQKRWAAVSQAKVKKGQTVTVVNSMDMQDFESPTLKRKFDHIAFGSLGGSGSDPHAGMDMKGHGAKDGGMMGGSPAGMMHGGRAEVKGPIKVAKASGPDARTIAEVYAQRTALKGKTVVVAGQVVKYTPDILDGNWAHIRDGSGSSKDGSDDLTVVLKEPAEMGATIVARGKVVLNKDLGGMYKFAVVLEDAHLVK